MNNTYSVTSKETEKPKVEVSKQQNGVKAAAPDSIDYIFSALDAVARGSIKKSDLLGALARNGVLEDDIRIKDTVQGNPKDKEALITPDTFRKLIAPDITVIEKAMTGRLVVPDFSNFCGLLTNIHNRTVLEKTGDVSDYIPQLGIVEPDAYGISVCTIDGQRFNLGDCRSKFMARAVSTVINYCAALDELGEEEVHKRVGRAPKEKGFHYLMLNSDGVPHNPFDTGGALMISSMIKPGFDSQTKFSHTNKVWASLAGGIEPGFNNEAPAAEKLVASAEYTLAYFMKQSKLFSKDSDINQYIDFLFRCSATETTTEALAVIAATLANAGMCPTSGRKVLKPETVKNCLSLMYSCGMEGYSSEFSFAVGLPAKSGNSGVILLVIPNVAGIAVWSPKLNSHGISVRGLSFCQKLIQKFNFHNYDSLGGVGEKVDPRLNKNEVKMKGVMALVDAASRGDLFEAQRLAAAGIDLNAGDYDNRTPLHLAAAENHYNVVEFMLSRNVDTSPKDRWGGTPLADARRGNHEKIIALLERHGARD